MGDDQGHVAGSPCWVDLTSPDLVASARFYGGLFGWETALRGPVERTGGYLTFRLAGKDVAGLAPLADDEPPAWTLYIAVDSVDEIEGVVVGNGGAPLLPPTDVLDIGRTALFTDPTGAVFGVWEAKEHLGAGLVDAPGAMCWHQLASRDAEAAKEFYTTVFGWVGITVPYEGSSFTTFFLDGRDPGPEPWGSGGVGRAVAGMVEMDNSWPRDLPSHWIVFFAVADCDAAADEVVMLGGEVSVEPHDMPDVGRLAVLGDPHGALFAVVTWADETVITPRRTPFQRSRGHR